MKTIHVLLNKATKTPLSDVYSAGESGIWRIGNNAEQGIDQIVIWDESTSSKLKAPVTDIIKSDTDPGFIFIFDKSKAKIIDVIWKNRPKLNQIGWTIR